jgi:glycosidase
LENGKVVTNAAQLTRHDDQAQVLYSLMIDRFQNGNKKNDWKMNSPEVLDIVDYQGGDIAGITQKIKEGFFNDLGITTIWISPITQNPMDAWGYYPFNNGNKYDNTKTYTKFSGYHGYWPIYATVVEKRFTTEEELHEMLTVAHEHGLNVILDYVANHMHINSPTLQEHPDWHTDSILPDGRRNFELWDEARLTTWFDVHIPTLDLERPEVCAPMTDSALVWLEQFDFDGFRHDACKHIPLNYWRELGAKMKQRYPNRHIWMIGETYGNPQLIGSYVKSGMLNSQFDFNIYHTAIDVLGKPNQSLKSIHNTIMESLATYGAHHTMGNISGNHDKCRFISLAGGAISWNENDKAAGWEREIGVTADGDVAKEEAAYKAAMLLEVLNLTIPGVPCIYQGDEYAEAGANDPDNRHMMKFDGLTERQQQFREDVQGLIHMRRNSMPLMYGEYVPITVTDNILVFERTYMGETVRVTIDLPNLEYSIQ